MENTKKSSFKKTKKQTKLPTLSPTSLKQNKKSKIEYYNKKGIAYA
jgi:hypothetical protein